MRWIVGLTAAILAASPIHAAPEPILGPAAAWVQPVTIPAPAPGASTKPAQVLLFSSQTFFTADGPESHVETAVLIQDPQGLAAAGTVAIPWNPDQYDLVFHKVHIVRGGKIVDVLANQRFTVVRRENNLERAMLDGVLTAVVQPEGLSVGDTLNLAFSIRAKPGKIAFLGENSVFIDNSAPPRKVFVRQIWPAAKPIRWKVSPTLGSPKLSKTKLGNELVVELDDPRFAKVAADAPARYQLPNSVEISEYGNWAQVGSLYAPYYDAAETLAPDSPLKAEIARIGAAGADPGQRAMAALRLVQDKVRYVALGMGDGGYIPVHADQVWSRKLGDCKGKTALLIALLRGLEIRAEPVLVSTVFGDGLGDRLPHANAFDHILVRATIGGRDYWLDGTKTGDRRLEDLASSPFGWGLPVRSPGAEIERLPLLPPALPWRETNFTYDASGGFERSVPMKGEIIFRGDAATAFQLAYAQAGREDMRAAMDRWVSGLPAKEDVGSYDFKSDDLAGTFIFTFAGKAKMDWYSAASSRALRFQFSNEVIAWEANSKRDVPSDLPHRLSFPVYATSRETVILPNGGAGFSIDGKDLSASVAETEIKRTISIGAGKAVAFSSFRRLRDEISDARLQAAEAAIKAVNDDEAYVRAPVHYKPAKAEIDALVKDQLTTADDYVVRGFRLMEREKYNKALEDFDKAIALDPQNATAHADRGIALINLGKLDLAEASLAKAAAMDEAEFVVHQGYGMLYLSRDDPARALPALTRSLDLDPQNPFTLNSRAQARAALGDFADALTDTEAVIAAQPDNAYPLWIKARLLAELGRMEGALTAADAAIAKAPDDAFFFGYKGELLIRAGRKEEARIAFAKAIALVDAKLERSKDDMDAIAQKISILTASGDYKAAIATADRRLVKQFDNVEMLSSRCLTRAVAAVELDKALADCNRAFEYDPGRSKAVDARALVHFRKGNWDAAIADFTLEISYEPHSGRAYYGRGLARLRKGDTAGGEKDLSAARLRGFDTHVEYDLIGIGIDPRGKS